MTRTRRPPSIAATGTVAHTGHDTLTLAEYRRLRGLDDERQADELDRNPPGPRQPMPQSPPSPRGARGRPGPARQPERDTPASTGDAP